MSGMNVSQFAYFCYALKVCTLLMIVNYMLFKMAMIAIAYLNTTLAISAVYAIIYLLCTFSVMHKVPAWSICQNVLKLKAF